jgi:F0F1-type ATP synthase membrane subunit b/b'
MVRIRYLTLLSLLILTFAFVGCGGGIPQEQYDSIQKDYEAAKSQLSSQQQQLDTTKEQLASVQNTVNATKSQLDAAQNQIKNLQDTLASQAAALDQTQKQSSKQSSQFEQQLNSILDTKVTQYYQFISHAVQYLWQLQIPLRSYFGYKAKTRPTEPSKLGIMVTDADANALLDVLVSRVRDATLNNNLRSSDVVNLVAKFVQTLPGANKDVTTPYDGYPRFPLETLFEQGGDSQDASILAAAILIRLNYNVVLFNFDAQEHMAIGVDMPGTGGYSWEYNAKRYYYLETTTGEALVLGDCPPKYRDIQPTIYPTSS